MIDLLVGIFIIFAVFSFHYEFFNGRRKFILALREIKSDLQGKIKQGILSGTIMNFRYNGREMLIAFVFDGERFHKYHYLIKFSANHSKQIDQSLSIEHLQKDEFYFKTGNQNYREKFNTTEINQRLAQLIKLTEGSWRIQSLKVISNEIDCLLYPTPDVTLNKDVWICIITLLSEMADVVEKS